MADDLNGILIPNADGPDEPLAAYDVESADAAVTVHMRGLDRALIERIRESEAVFGCVAWLTHPGVLRALSTKQTVALVVQKEDFLRPDIAAAPGFARSLRQAYAMLRSPHWRCDYPSPLCYMSVANDPRLDPVRCFVNHNSIRKATSPRMHHKFFVFATVRNPPPEVVDQNLPWEDGFDPYAVWTGSFNPTVNGTRSLENAVYIRHRGIAEAYYKEWAQIMAASEPLDWESEWCAPEWRIGT